MKFCYVDESGYGSEPVFVITGIITDSTRMHLIKDVWSELLSLMRRVTGRNIREFRARDLYCGRGAWYRIRGEDRARIITGLLELIRKRRHSLTFSSIQKDRYNSLRRTDSRLQQLGSFWCTSAFHLALSIQRYHQKEEKSKGHTVLICDRENREERRIISLFKEPLDWSDEYYGKRRTQKRMDQIVDVPYFADSEHVLLIQVADLVAYLLRRYAELEGGLTDPNYEDEPDRLSDWAQLVASIAQPVSHRYLQRGRGEVAKMFWDIAPDALRILR